MDALRCPPGDADVTKLSGGEKRRVALCRCCCSKPDMLLLDEPTNHLDAESVPGWSAPADFPARSCVTHDRYFLDNVTGWILELDRGRASLRGQLLGLAGAEGQAPGAGRAARTARAAHLAASSNGSLRPQGPPGQVQGPHRAPTRSWSKARRARDRRPREIVIPPGPRLGDDVIEAEGLNKGFGDKLLIDNLSFKLPPGGIVGVIGPNGAGKTTLFRMITGQEKPDAARSRSARR
jgi:ATPase subunit of ABC transporter with duplicated ATPase domains